MTNTSDETLTPPQIMNYPLQFRKKQELLLLGIERNANSQPEP